MKKIFYLSLGAAMMLCLTNCAKTEEPGKPDVVPGPGEQEVLDFSLYAATPTLKTVNDGLDTKWASGDAINLFHAAAGQKTYINDGKFSLSSEDVVNGLFKGKLSQALAGGGSYDWYAVYPYNSANTTPAGASASDAAAVKIGDLSLTQNGNDSKAHLAGEICPLYGVAKAVGSGDVLSIPMRQLTSVVAVKVINTASDPLTVSSVSFTSTEDIVGTYFINYSDPESVVYTATSSTDVSSTAQLNVVGAAEIAKDGNAVFYIPIKPHKVAGGKLSIAVNGVNKEITVENISFAAGSIVPMEYSYVVEEPAPAVNLALRKTATADCEANPESMFHITDGGLANMWQCNTAHAEHWAKVDLGEKLALNNIIISWNGAAYAKNIKISLSTNDKDYTEVYSVTDWSPVAEPREPGNELWTKVVTDAQFSTTEAQYIKVDFNGDSFIYGITIYELEAYCRN